MRELANDELDKIRDMLEPDSRHWGMGELEAIKSDTWGLTERLVDLVTLLIRKEVITLDDLGEL